MNNKKLAGLIKNIRSKKITQKTGVTGRTSPFRPVGIPPQHPGSVRDAASPNIRKTVEEDLQISSQLGPRRARKMNPRKNNLGRLEARRTSGNQSMTNRYEEREIEVEKTDTNDKKSRKNTITVNPELPAMSGQLKQ